MKNYRAWEAMLPELVVVGAVIVAISVVVVIGGVVGETTQNDQQMSNVLRLTCYLALYIQHVMRQNLPASR